MKQENTAQETIMARETVVALWVTGIALAVGVVFVVSGLKNGWPIWGIGLALAMVAFFSGITIYSFLPGVEEKLAAQWSQRADVRPTMGRVVAVRHLGVRETEKLRETCLSLNILVTNDGGEHHVELSVWIEDALLSNFASGRTVHLLFDPNDPAKAVIDRRQTPVRVE